MQKATKEEIVRRLNRIKGQVEGLLRMAERPKTVSEIFNQITAAKKALDSTGRFVLEQYINENLASVSKSKEESEKVKEIIELMEKF